MSALAATFTHLIIGLVLMAAGVALLIRKRGA